MHSSSIITQLVAIASFAAATAILSDTNYGVSINVIASPGSDPNKTWKPAPVVGQISLFSTPISMGMSYLDL